VCAASVDGFCEDRPELSAGDLVGALPSKQLANLRTVFTFF